MSKKVWDYWATKYEKHWVQKYSLGPTRNTIINELHNIIKPGTSLNILDMSCAIGQLIYEVKNEFISYDLNIIGVDISSKMLELAKIKNKDITFYNSSIFDFETVEKFDIIMCSHSFPYYQDQEKAIKKFNNLLNDNGYLLLAQASINNFYDKISMFAVKFYTGFGKYPSIKKIESLTKEHFNLIKVIKIKEKFFMPSICLFLLTKKGETNND